MIKIRQSYDQDRDGTYYKDETVIMPSDLWNVYLISGVTVFVFVMGILISGKTAFILNRVRG